MRKERLHAAITQEAQNRFLALRDVMCIRDFISGWFHGAPFESVHATDAAAFVAYGFLNSRLEDLSPQASTPRSHAWAGHHHGRADTLGLRRQLYVATWQRCQAFTWSALFITNTLAGLCRDMPSGAAFALG